MSIYNAGDFPTSATVIIPINTFDSNDPTASVTATNLVNTDVHIHKDGGTTQRNNAAGITMTIDFDSITGNHILIIDTSDNTVADFYQAGHEYQVRVEGVTVDGATINAWVGTFSIERAGGALALIKNGTYGLSALNALLAHADYGLAKLVRSTTPANTLSVDANHLVAVPSTQKIDLVDAPNATAITAINLAISNKIGTPQDLGNGTATLAGNLSDIDSETDLIYGAVQGIGTAGGAAISIDAAGDNYGGGITGVTSGTTKVGTQTGTYANASNVNAVYHIMTHDTQVVDIVYQFLTGGGTSPVGVRWTGILNPNGDAATVYAWNHVLNNWESIGSIAGQSSTTVNVAKTFVLYARHRGTSAAELGKVYIRIASSAAYNHVVRTDQIIVDYAVTSQVTQGKVYINTATGTDGYDTGYNGIAGHPVKTIACALAICVAIGVKDIEVATGSTITLGASVAGYNFRGQYWTLALGNQNIAGAYFYGANVSGVSSGVDAWFDHCVIGTATIAQAFLELCLFAGTFTTIASGNYSIINGLDGIPGETNAVFVLTANTILGIRNWSGGININAMAATNIVVLDGRGKLILDSNNVAGEIRVRGNWDITDNVSGGFAGTLTKTANMNTSSPLTIAAGQYVNITRPTGAVVSGEGTSPTSFKTNLTSSEDDYIKDAYVKFTSGANINQVKKISAYNGTSKVITTAAFTDEPAENDTFVIINE